MNIKIDERTGLRMDRGWQELTVECSKLHDKWGEGVACEECPLFSGRWPLESISPEQCGVKGVMETLKNAGIPMPTK